MRFKPLTGLRRIIKPLLALSLLIVTVEVVADFTNGGFETGDFTGWVKSNHINGGVAVQSPADSTLRSHVTLNSGGADYTVIVTNATPESQYDPQLGSSSTLRFPKYGNDSAIVNYKLNGTGSANVLKQQMTITTADVDPADNLAHVRFAVAPVLEDGSHAPSSQPYYFVTVRNITKSTTIFNSYKYANQPGVPWKTGLGDYIYTDWQLVDVSPGAGQLDVGDVVEVEILASRCQPTGHAGYVYVDGVGSFLPGVSVVAYGPQSANTGSTFNYKYVYRNGATTAVDNATVRIVLPTGTTFSSVSAAGATCTTPSSGATGTVSCNFGTLSSKQSGSFEVTLNATGANGTKINLGNYEIYSDDTSALLGPLVTTNVTSGVSYADLETTITNGVAAVAWGQAVQYTLAVSNNGPSDVTGATIAYTAPARLTNVSWSCTPTGGAACATNGSGNISDSVNIPNGDSVVYTINADVIAGTGTNNIVNTSTATVPGGVVDNFSSNNAGVDTDQVGPLYEMTVNKSVAAAGTVTSVPAAISCGTGCSSTTADFVDGSSVSLSTVAATNYVFTGWSGGGCSGTGTCTVSMVGNTTITANFDCYDGYFGSTCASQCPGSGTCSGNGTCADGQSGAGTCTCSTGWTGSDCSVADTDSDGVPDSSDCAPSDAAKWRDQAYSDTDGDGVRDSITLGSVACFGNTPPTGATLTVNGLDNCPSASNSAQTDTDSDTAGDACDSDDDNDGVADGSDCASTNASIWRNQAYVDTDGDGVRDSITLGSVACFGTTPPTGSTLTANGPDNCPSVANAAQTDTDSDTGGDACDSDDDNDGVADSSDCASTNASIWRDQAYVDADGDGIRESTAFSPVACFGTTPPAGSTLTANGPDNCGNVSNADQGNMDNDSQGDVCDLDDDGDGIPDTDEGALDTDGDGIPNSGDNDSDNDGLPDVGEGGGDKDNDSVPDASDPDSDNDGIPDTVEGTSDSDSDGTPNYKDKDSDNDGILDSIESMTTGGFFPPSGVDTDGDGVDNAYDPDNGGSSAALADSDNDGIKDYIDPDSDNDGVSDLVEAFDRNNDGVPDTAPSGIDANGDGLDDAFSWLSAPSDLGYWRDSTNGVSSCQSVSLASTVNNVKRKSDVLRDRAHKFSNRARACGTEASRWKKADRLYGQIAALMKKGIGTSTMACPVNVCTTSSTTSTRNNLRKLSKALYQEALKAKLAAVAACPAQPKTGNDSRNNTMDDFKALRRALGNVPGTLTSCN